MGDRRCFSAVDGISVVSYGMGGLNLLIEPEVIEIFQFKCPWTVSLGIKSACIAEVWVHRSKCTYNIMVQQLVPPHYVYTTIVERWAHTPGVYTINRDFYFLARPTQFEKLSCVKCPRFPHRSSVDTIISQFNVDYAPTTQGTFPGFGMLEVVG